MNCSDSWCLKLVSEVRVSSFRDFCSSFRSLAVELWKERRPKGEFCVEVDQRITSSESDIIDVYRAERRPEN